MNYYEILELKKGASQEDIKKSYKRLIKKYHPDIYKGDKTFAEKKTAAINVAYDVLSNPTTRQEYDNEHFQNTNQNYNSNYTYNPNYYKSGYTNSQYNYKSYGYNKNNSSYYNSTKDGSEHDYSTYANYERFYTDYHRSKTPNSNYNYNPNSFSSKIFDKTNNLSKRSKTKLIFIIILLYFAFLLFSVIDLLFFKYDYNSMTPKNSSSYKNSIENNTSIIEPDISSHKHEIYTFFSKEEVQELYNRYITERNIYITFEEFENILLQHILSSDSF